MRKIEINKKVIEEIFEKKKHEKDKSIVTKNANLKILISSIFFPTQINKKTTQQSCGCINCSKLSLGDR